MGYGEGLASQTYGDTYQRSLGEFQQRYGIFRQNQQDLYGRLSGLAATGQNAANTSGALGGQAAGQVGSTLMGTGENIANAQQAAGAARASGYIGSANAWSGALGGMTNSLSTLKLSDLTGKESTGSGWR
jgi:hypothetical protein